MNSALISFGIYMIFVFLLAWIAGRKSLKSDSFVSEYFLGGRALGLGPSLLHLQQQTLQAEVSWAFLQGYILMGGY